jgi:hypothetical protein
MPKKKKWQIEEEQKKKDSIKYLAVGGAVIMFIMALLAITLPKEKVTRNILV